MNTDILLEHIGKVAEAPDGVERIRGIILDLAVRGRLTRRNPLDSDAAAFVHRIAEEGIVTDSALTRPTSADDWPWNIPDTWTWVRLKQIANFQAGKTPPTKDSTMWGGGDGIPWATIADMPPGGTLTTTNRTVTDKARQEVFRSSPAPKGTLLMSFKLTIGKVCRVGIPTFYNEAIIAVEAGTDQLADYLFLTLPILSPMGSSRNAVKGKTLNKTSLTNLLIPVPPPEEQGRVVDVVDRLMRQSDDLAEALVNRSALGNALGASLTASISEEEA